MHNIEIARNLVSSRKQTCTSSPFPGAVPNNIKEAYAIQGAMLDQLQPTIYGWKIGNIHAQHQASFGTARFAAPVLSKPFQTGNGNKPARLPLNAQWFQAIEFEVSFRAGQDLYPNDWDFNKTSIIKAMDAACASVELLSSPVKDIIQLGPGAAVSDLGLNSGIILGQAIPDFTLLMHSDIAVQVRDPEIRIASGSTASVPGGIGNALEFLMSEIKRRQTFIKKGDWICTGATTGLHIINDHTHMLAEFNGCAPISLEIT